MKQCPPTHQIIEFFFVESSVAVAVVFVEQAGQFSF